MRRSVILAGCGVFWLGLCGCDGTQYSGNGATSAAPAEKPALLQDPDYLKALKRSEQHVESKKEYIASTQKVGGRKDPIYLKEFLKSPEKFTGTRLAVLGKIMHIEEQNGHTGLQMYVDRNLDSVIVKIDQSVKVYEGDVIQVYGEGAGTLEGENRMGASMTWPLIQAKYIVLKRHAEDS